MSEAGQIAETVARASYGRLLALIAARTGDVSGAEDALSEAFAAALALWPAAGVPNNPQAWLLTVARGKVVDSARRSRTCRKAGAHLQLLAEELAAAPASDVPDERLALMFVCAHRAIDEAVRAPLMLQTVLGMDAATIASAFLTAPAAMGQRLARAKARIRLAGIAFRLPERADLPARLGPVLEAIYTAFSSGWSDPAGTEFRRRGLAQEAIWLGRLLVSLLPDEPEALGLLALMLYAEARRHARRTPDGHYVPLDEQDVTVWDSELIDRAEGLLLRASAMGVVGRFQLEAAVQSAHVVRRQTGRSDWAAIVRLYDTLATVTASPVVAINRAVRWRSRAAPPPVWSNWICWPVTPGLLRINRSGPHGPGFWRAPVRLSWGRRPIGAQSAWRLTRQSGDFFRNACQRWADVDAAPIVLQPPQRT